MYVFYLYINVNILFRSLGVFFLWPLRGMYSWRWCLRCLILINLTEIPPTWRSSPSLFLVCVLASSHTLIIISPRETPISVPWGNKPWVRFPSWTWFYKYLDKRLNLYSYFTGIKCLAKSALAGTWVLLTAEGLRVPLPCLQPLQEERKPLWTYFFDQTGDI